MKIFIIFENSEGKRSYSFDDKLLIGRSEKCQLRIQDDLASGTHCLLIMKGKDLCVEDMNSKNGTYINNIRIISSRLCMNDVLKIGNSFIRIDPVKNSEEVKKLLQYDGSYRRDRGELTLELEDVDSIRRGAFAAKKQMKEGNFRTTEKQKDFVKNSKLYEGGDAYAPDSAKTLSKTKLSFLNYVASLFDNIVTLAIFLIPIFCYKLTLPKETSLNMETIRTTAGLITLVISGIAAVAFRKWNLKQVSTLGEKLFRL